jgi:glycosyltransferase involved in cell wall biosynthesis
MPLAILHLTAGLHPASGGPSRTVVHLTDALARVPGLAVTLLTQSPAGAPTVPSANPAVTRRVLETSSPWALKAGLPVWRALAACPSANRPALLHGHGLWTAVNHWTARAARRWDIPLILHPRGMLEPWAIQHKGGKKRLALALYQRRDLATARVLVATAEQEYANLRALGLRQPIAIIPNGVPLPPANAELARPPHPLGAPRTVLFLGRIYPVKGLLNLVDAWAQVRPAGWRLQIAGPDEAGHLAEVLALARRLGVAEAVDYVGAVEGAAKSALYRQADVFVLPSFTENFGLVVAEALAHGLPVITTQGTPWADLPAFGCGWWIGIGVEPLAEALQAALALSDAERAAMGARGLAYVRRYDWSTIAENMAAVYRWVLEQGGKPECVRLD